MRVKKPDHKNALSLIIESENQMKFTLTIPVTEDSAFTVLRNIYECFRMLGDALLANQGLETTDHIEPLNALLKLNIDTKRPINTIDSLRRIRHNINYYGYHPTIIEANYAIDIAKSCFWQLSAAIKKELEKS